MKCANHGDREATSICKQCIMPVCEECHVAIEGEGLCKSCVQKRFVETEATARMQIHVRKNNGFLQFISSLIPGVGQMYNGAMRRGIELILLFGFVTAVSEMFFYEFSWFLGMVSSGVVAAIYFFSFFDSYQVRTKKYHQIDQWDAPLFPGEGKYFPAELIKKIIQSNYIGWAMLLAGAYMLISIISQLTYVYIPYHIAVVVELVLSLIIPTILFGCGVRLVKKERRMNACGDIVNDDGQKEMYTV